jgi:glycosyltransferase involved in cell wall biosynthesis
MGTRPSAATTDIMRAEGAPCADGALTRVLHITLRADFTGGPLYTFKLIQGLKSGGVVNYVACPLDRPLSPELTRLVGADHTCELPERSFNIAALRRLARFIRDHRIDLVHSHGKGAGIYARLVSLITPAKVVHTFHGLHFRHYGKAAKLGYRALERSMSALSDSVVAVIDSEKQVAVAQGFAPAMKVTVIRTGLQNVPPLARWDDGGPVNVVHFNRFDVQKNFDAMLSIARAAKAAGLDEKLRFLIIGDGPRRVEYEAMAAADGTSGFFEFLGIVPDVADVTESCKALISTSRWEGLPVAPLEAGQAGLFLALSRIPGHDELVLADSGAMLFDLDDPAQHRRVAERLVSLRAWRVGDAAHRDLLLEAFSYDKMIAQHVDLYDRIAARA